MIKILKVSLSLSCLVLSVPSYASKYFDGHQALQMCQGQSQEMTAGCAMFIVGSAESLRMVGYSGERYCLGDNVTNKILRREFVSYLKQQQNSLKYSAASLFYANLIQNHPCEAKTK